MSCLHVKHLFVIILLCLFLILGCSRENSTEVVQAELKEIGKEIPILKIMESEIEIGEQDARIVSYSLKGDGKAPYPETFKAGERILFWRDTGAGRLILIGKDKTGKEVSRRIWEFGNREGEEEERDAGLIKPRGFYIKNKSSGEWKYYGLAYVNGMTVGQKAVLAGALDDGGNASYLMLYGAGDLWNEWKAFKAALGDIEATAGGFFTGTNSILPAGTQVLNVETGEPFDPHTGEALADFQLFFSPSATQTSIGTTISVEIRADALPLFRTAETVLSYTGGVILSGCVPGSVMDTDGKLLFGTVESDDFYVHAAHLYGQSSVGSSGVLLTLQIQVSGSGTVRFQKSRIIDDNLGALELRTGPELTVIAQ